MILCDFKRKHIVGVMTFFIECFKRIETKKNDLPLTSLRSSVVSLRFSITAEMCKKRRKCEVPFVVQNSSRDFIKSSMCLQKSTNKNKKQCVLTVKPLQD